MLWCLRLLFLLQLTFFGAGLFPTPAYGTGFTQHQITTALFTATTSASSQDTQFYAQLDPVVFKTTPQYGSSVTVIHSKDLENKSYTQVLDILKNEAGLDVISTGGMGQTTTVFIRGAKSEHTLVLIDGVEANDPSTPTRLFDFSNLSTENIERIEIFRGANSVRFGPDAFGGVINIITKSDGSRPQSLFHLESGSFGSLSLGLSHLNQFKSIHSSTALSFTRTDGFSSADSPLAGSSLETDGFRRWSLSQKMLWEISEFTQIDFLLRGHQASTDLDSEGGPSGDDPNYISKSSQVMARAKVTQRLLPTLKTSLSLSSALHKREYDNTPDSSNPTLYQEDFDSQSLKAESITQFQVLPKTRIDGILQYRHETASSEQNFNGTLSQMSDLSQHLFGQALLIEHRPTDQLGIEFGARHDHASHGSTESLWSQSLSAEYTFQNLDLKLNANIGTAVKTPSLFQLYSTYGNENLNSEEALTWDLSLEKVWFDSHHFVLAVFGQHYSELIDFNTLTSKYENISGARILGAEISSFHHFNENWELQLHYKFLDTLDEIQKLSLLRRPDHTVSAQIQYQYAKIMLQLGLRYVNSRPDMDPVTWQRISLPSYFIGQWQSSFSINENLILKLRIENLWDKTYQDIAGYKTSPVAVYLALSGRF